MNKIITIISLVALTLAACGGEDVPNINKHEHIDLYPTDQANKCAGCPTTYGTVTVSLVWSSASPVDNLPEFSYVIRQKSDNEVVAAGSGSGPNSHVLPAFNEYVVEFQDAPGFETPDDVSFYISRSGWSIRIEGHYVKPY